MGFIDELETDFKQFDRFGSLDYFIDVNGDILKSLDNLFDVRAREVMHGLLHVTSVGNAKTFVNGMPMLHQHMPNLLVFGERNLVKARTQLGCLRKAVVTIAPRFYQGSRGVVEDDSVFASALKLEPDSTG